jgi:RHS repeat-associated protein
MVFISQKVRNRYSGTYKLLAPIYWRFRDSKSSDKLTSYNGKAITYDAIGNPLTYDGYTFKWGGGRTLTSITGNSKNINYNYNIDGIRTDKTVDGVNYKYTLEGNKVVHEQIANGSTVDKMVYNYGDSGLVGFTLNGTEYFYIRNSQSDIIGILDSNGTQVVSYTYDTWGKLISITGDKVLGEKNPYRYRGYRYDTETGYYYLQSRYYNPEMGRFLNIDALGGNVGALLSHNIFTYCNNNPANTTDPNGFRPIYTMGEETGAMRDASYKSMAKAAVAISNKLSSMSTSTVTNSKGNTLKEAILGSMPGPLSVTVFSICENFGDDIVLGSMRTKLYGISTKIPVTLGVFEDAFKQLGVVGLGLSIYDNRSYGLGTGLVRSGIDILGFAAAAAFTASGGWVAIGCRFRYWCSY